MTCFSELKFIFIKNRLDKAYNYAKIRYIIQEEKDVLAYGF